MQEKGALTPEQAQEVLEALSEDAEGTDAAAEGGGETTRAADVAEPERVKDEPRSGPHGHDDAGSFLDMGWVGDMVDGITSGLGIATDHGDRRTGGDGHGYHDRWSQGGRHGNYQNSSRVEQPEGEDFEFRDNKVVFSKIRGLRLMRAKVKDNYFSASTFRDSDITDGSMESSSFAGASLHELHVEKGEIKDVSVSGSKLSRATLRGGSVLKGVRISGSGINGLTLENSAIEDARMSGLGLNGLTLSNGSLIKDTRFSGVTLGHVSLERSTMTDTRMSGAMLANVRLIETEMVSLDLRGARFQDTELRGSRVTDARFDAIGFVGLRVQNSTMRKVLFRGEHGRLPSLEERLSVVDSNLENVEFVGCVFHDTVFKGISVEGLRLRGVDLSDMTVENAEDLRALADH